MSLKILVIRFSSIGDIVLTTPVVRALKKQLGAEVHFLTKSSFADILLVNPNISKVITLSDDFEKMIMMLKHEKYDHVIDLHHNLRSARIKLALKVYSSSFHKLNFEKWLMVNFKINRLPPKHIVDRYLDTISFLGAHNDGEGLDFYMSSENKINVPEKFGKDFRQYIAIMIGAAHETKCMTVDQIAYLCELIDMPVILLGGSLETEKANQIISKSISVKIKNACGLFDIFQSASIVQQSSAFITPDTGMMHIAAALKKTQIVVWGNTIPEFGMYPYYGNHNIRWISFEQFPKCRPCSKLGYSKCPKGHFKCMLDHDLHAIALAAKQLG